MSKNKLTKSALIDWLAQYHDGSYNGLQGYTNYFGYKMSIDDFKKEMNKKQKWELEEQVFNTSDEGQQFIESHEGE